jgi:hypothetical protein
MVATWLLRSEACLLVADKVVDACGGRYRQPGTWPRAGLHLELLALQQPQATGFVHVMLTVFRAVHRIVHDGNQISVPDMGLQCNTPAVTLTCGD